MAVYSTETPKLPNFKNDVNLVRLAKPEASAAELYKGAAVTDATCSSCKSTSYDDHAQA